AVNPIAQEDSPFTLSFPLTMFNDVDVGDSLDYSAQLANGQPLPDWLTFDAATLTFSGTPENDDVDDLTIQLIASDGEANVSFQFVIGGEAVNDNPVASGSITINTVEDAAGDQLDLFATFSDEETPANQLQYSVVSNSNPTLVTSATIDAQTGKLTFSYGANQFGSSDLIIRARDVDGAIVETPVRINIAPVNDVPVSTGIADIRVDAGATPQQIDLDKIFSDIEEGASLKYSLIANTNPTVATNVQWDQATGAMTITFASAAGGESLISIRAQDSNGAWVETRFKVTVVPPVVVPPGPEIPTNPPVVNPPVIPPTNPPVIDIPTVPPTTPSGGSVDGSSGGGVVISPPGIIVDPSLPNGEQPPSLLVDDPQDNFNLPGDKSSRDYERIKAAINNDVSLSLLTASPSLVSLISPDAGFSPWEAADFDNEVRRVREQMDIALDEEQNRKAIIAGITFSVTTGILVWSLRASSLLLTLMSMLPLWRGFDPLPILDEMNKRKKKLEQQREDKRLEDRHVHEVGYLFDQANNKSTNKI
ncbi:MAG TPA: putative Ig domain-containing protein, partial [Cellvibrio sp.]